MFQYRDGESRTINGTTYVRQGGQWIPQGGMTQSAPSMQTAPADPRLPYQVQQQRNEATASAFDPQRAAADLEGQRLSNRTAEANLERAQIDARQAQTGQNARAGLIDALEGQLDDLEAVYNQHFRGAGVGSVMEYLPTEANQRFRSIANQMRSTLKPLIRGPGEGTFTDADQRLLDSLIPQPSNFDSYNEATIEQLRARLAAERSALGLPERTPPQPVELPGMDRTQQQSFTPSGQEQQTLSGGGTRMEEDPVLRGLSGRIGRMVAEGAPDREILDLLREAGVRPGDTNIGPVLRFRRTPDFQTWRQQNPGTPYPIGESFYSREVPQTGVRRNFSAVSESPVGAYGISAAQGLTGNRLDELVGATGGNAEQARAGIAGMRENNPVSSLLGDVSGQGLAMYGGAGLLSRAPRLAAHIASNPVTRTAGRRAAAGDAAYGAYAGSGDDNLVAGTLANVAGGQVGSAAMRGAGRVVGGTRDAAVRALDARGIPMTVGQIAGQGGMAGRMVRGIEQRAAGYPVIGDMISGQYRQGIRSGVREAHQEALSQIGGTATEQVGEEAVDSTLQQINGAFRDALRGVNLRRDRPFSSSFRAATRAAQRPALTQEVRNVTGSALAQIDELFVGGQLTGDGLQAALQILGEARGAVAGLPMGQGGVSALRQAERAITGMARRQSPNVMPALNQARQAYRRFAVVRNATRSAAGESEGMFTPLQLNRADVNNTTQFGGRNASASTRRPFFDLTNAERQVLPNRVPDSGTAGRAALGAGGLIGAGAGSDALGLTDDGTGLGLGVAAAAGTTLPYTNIGRNALQAAMVRRPESLRRAGGAMIDDEWLQYISRLIGASQGPYQTTEKY